VEQLEVKVGAGRDCSGCKDPGAPMVVGGCEAEEDDSDLDVEEIFGLPWWAKKGLYNRRDYTQAKSLVLSLVVLMLAALFRFDCDGNRALEHTECCRAPRQDNANCKNAER
jgi:hypothetical protein